MDISQFEKSEFWRAIIMFGLNTATYKIALGQCLVQFADEGKTQITMTDLAERFFDLYVDRLQNGKAQLAHPHRQTTMETIVSLYNIGRLDRAAAIGRVSQEAFGDVVPRFHTVGHIVLPVSFYEQTKSGLVLTDHLFEIFTQEQRTELIQELAAKWSLLEAAFEMRRDNAKSSVVNDTRLIYLQKGSERKSITHLRDVLGACQRGTCFYCGVSMGSDTGHIDHVIPRQAIRHDEDWNLVLAHTICNLQKSDALPGAKYLDRLMRRNEHLIAINHPLKQQLLTQLGATEKQRTSKMRKQYEDARLMVGYTWEGIRGYDPETDEFYKTIVQSLI